MAKKAALLLVLAFLAACLAVGVYLYAFVRYPTAEQEEQAAFADVVKLRVQTVGAGLIQVDGEDRADVAAVANRLVAPRLPWRNDAPFARIREERRTADGTLHWRVSAPTDWRLRSEVALHFAAPRATAVETESDDANVTLRGLAGPVAVTQTGGGTVVLENVTGPTTVAANRGLVRVEYATAPSFNVSVRDGQLLLTLRAVNPGPMHLQIRQGQAILQVPRDVNADLTYRTTGLVMDPFTDDKPAAKPVTRRLGQGGAAILVEAEQADLTFLRLEDE
jgi:hypothetical protein